MDSSYVMAIAAVLSLAVALVSSIRAETAIGEAKRANLIAEASNRSSGDAVREAHSANILSRESNGIAHRSMIASEGATTTAVESLGVAKATLQAPFRARLALYLFEPNISVDGSRQFRLSVVNEGTAPAHSFTIFTHADNAAIEFRGGEVIGASTYTLNPSQILQGEMLIVADNWHLPSGPYVAEPRAYIDIGYRDYLGGHLLKFTYSFAIVFPILLEALEDESFHVQSPTPEARLATEQMIQDYASRANAELRSRYGIPADDPDWK
jgi:hypothetical protein